MVMMILHGRVWANPKCVVPATLRAAPRQTPQGAVLTGYAPRKGAKPKTQAPLQQGTPTQQSGTDLSSVFV